MDEAVAWGAVAVWAAVVAWDPAAARAEAEAGGREQAVAKDAGWLPDTRAWRLRQTRGMIYACAASAASPSPMSAVCPALK